MEEASKEFSHNFDIYRLISQWCNVLNALQHQRNFHWISDDFFSIFLARVLNALQHQRNFHSQPKRVGAGKPFCAKRFTASKEFSLSSFASSLAALKDCAKRFTASKEFSLMDGRYRMDLLTCAKRFTASKEFSLRKTFL